MKKKIPWLIDRREFDATDPYIMGEPMGWIGCTIFFTMMVIVPITLACYPLGKVVYDRLHQLQPACVSGTHK